MNTSLGEPNAVAIGFFVLFITVSLGITVWASRRTRSTEQFYAAGRSVTALQNGLALAGDYMSAASFLGIAGLVATSGFDGLIYSIGWLVGWPIVTFLIAEPLRNLGRYTFADVVAFRLSQKPVRIAASIGALAERDVDVDPAAIAAALTAIREQLELVRTLKAQLTSISTATKAVWTGLDTMRSNILLKVTEAEAEIRAAI